MEAESSLQGGVEGTLAPYNMPDPLRDITPSQPPIIDEVNVIRPHVTHTLPQQHQGASFGWFVYLWSFS